MCVCMHAVREFFTAPCVCVLCREFCASASKPGYTFPSHTLAGEHHVRYFFMSVGVFGGGGVSRQVRVQLILTPYTFIKHWSPPPSGIALAGRCERRGHWQGPPVATRGTRALPTYTCWSSKDRAPCSRPSVVHAGLPPPAGATPAHRCRCEWSRRRLETAVEQLIAGCARAASSCAPSSLRAPPPRPLAARPPAPLLRAGPRPRAPHRSTPCLPRCAGCIPACRMPTPSLPPA